MIETNKYKLGVFVASVILLFIVVVTCMGFFDFLNAKARLYTVVEESVQGLNTGSAVKLRGVPIGKITNIQILTDSKNIRIEMEVDLTKFSRKAEKTEQEETITSSEFYHVLSKEISNGLRCRIEPDGITGMKYLEIDFYKDKVLTRKQQLLTTSLNEKGNFFYIPSIPSMLSSLRISMTEIIARIAMIDFEKISQQMTTLLNNANRTLDAKRLDQIFGNINACVDSIRKNSDNLNAVLTKTKAEELLREIRNAIRSVSDLTGEMKNDIQQSHVPETVADLRKLSNELGNTSGNIDTTLQKLNDAIDALSELILYLNDNPASLIYGKNAGGKLGISAEKAGKDKKGSF